MSYMTRRNAYLIVLDAPNHDFLLLVNHDQRVEKRRQLHLTRCRGARIFRHDEDVDFLESSVVLEAKLAEQVVRLAVEL